MKSLLLHIKRVCTLNKAKRIVNSFGLNFAKDDWTEDYFHGYSHDKFILGYFSGIAIFCANETRIYIFFPIGNHLETECNSFTKLLFNTYFKNSDLENKMKEMDDEYKKLVYHRGKPHLALMVDDLYRSLTSIISLIAFGLVYSLKE